MVDVGYWEERYRGGGTSGPGSLGSEKRWKWGLIRRYAGVVDDVLDVGCGDLSFWDGLDCPRYLGLDLSPHVQVLNAQRRPRWRFQVLDATKEPLPAGSRIVFCFDVLFHVMDGEGFEFLLRNLASATGAWLFMTNFSYNAVPGGGTSDGVYQVYRDLTGFLPLLEPLRLAKAHRRGNKVFYALERGEGR